LSKKLIHLLMI